MSSPNFIASSALILGICTGSASAQEFFGTFVDLPIALESSPSSLPKPFKVTKPLHFKDPNGLDWVVPVGSYTDGASIPWLFEIIVGDNYGGPYFPASVVHDYFCCIQTRTAHDTHRNFYYAMQANGTPSWQAWLMYTAVRIGGPDWTLTQTPIVLDGTQCFDEVVAVSLSSMPGAVPQTAADDGMIIAQYSASPNFDAFLRAATTAQNQRDTFVLSKLMAVAKTLKESDGKVIDVNAFGQIPATFEGVEQLKSMVTGATSFAGFSTAPERTNFADFGLLVPVDGELSTAVAGVKAQGGLINIETGWSAQEFSKIGIAQDDLPQSLPDTYLVEAARTTNLKGTGIEWAAPSSIAERDQWNQIIDADRSYKTWLNTRDSLATQR